MLISVVASHILNDTISIELFADIKIDYIIKTPLVQ